MLGIFKHITWPQFKYLLLLSELVGDARLV